MDLSQAREIIKCCEDVQYFVENYVYVYRPDVGRVLASSRPEIIDVLNFSSSSDIKNGVLIVDGERQVGKTTTLAIAALYTAVFDNWKAVHIHTFRNDAASEIIHKIYEMYQNLPEWMRPKITKYNKIKIEFENGCQITGGSTLSHIKGRSINLLLFDESGWDTRFEEVYTTFMPVLTCTGKVILASTRNPGSYFNKLADESKNIIKLTRNV